MYTFFIAVQYLGIGVLLLEILYIYRQRNSSFIGFLFEMRATTQEMALQVLEHEARDCKWCGLNCYDA